MKTAKDISQSVEYVPHLRPLDIAHSIADYMLHSAELLQFHSRPNERLVPMAVLTFDYFLKSHLIECT